MELERICDDGTIVATSQQIWRELHPKVLHQAELDSQHSQQLQRTLEEIPKDSQLHYCIIIILYITIESDSLLSLMLLPLLLPNSRCRADYTKILYFTKVYAYKELMLLL